ncbi:MAG: hypothetical protein ABSH12_08270 [Endomicrobiales bacterium]|jgi:hypothetical protein
MLAIVFGLIFIMCGMWGILRWLPDTLMILRGMLPGMLCCGGVLAVIAGIASIRDNMEAKAQKKNKSQTSPLQK